MIDLEVGQEVTAFNTFPQEWWSKDTNFMYGKVYPLVITGVITKLFKSGKMQIAVNEMINDSADGKRSMHIDREHLVSNWQEA